MVNFDCCCPLPTGISLATTREKDKERERGSKRGEEEGGPRCKPWGRCLLLVTSDEAKTVFFSSFEATRRRDRGDDGVALPSTVLTLPYGGEWKVSNLGFLPELVFWVHRYGTSVLGVSYVGICPCAVRLGPVWGEEIKKRGGKKEKVVEDVATAEEVEVEAREEEEEEVKVEARVVEEATMMRQGGGGERGLSIRGPTAIGQYRQNRSLVVDFGRRWPIEGEIDCRQSNLVVGGRLREKSTVNGQLREKKKRRRRKT
ncbi:hypothetical protein BHM03_00001928 [Ensete ventricosum]|nr:hypothetical protein BHM03_00001928 [Ensete ventricosum]